MPDERQLKGRGVYPGSQFTRLHYTMVRKAWKPEPEVTVNLQVRAVRELNSPSSCTLSL